MVDSDLVTRPTNPDGLVLEAWGQGLMVGALVVMSAITVANMRKRVLLHKLILAELVLAMFHGTWIFAHEPAYGWYLSVTAIGLNISWSLHNVIAWMKNRPFLSRRVSIFYITTVILVQPYWVLEIYANFTYFNNINKIFLKTRPLEPLFRDPWWLFTTCSLFYTIKREYNFGLIELIRVSPRFGVMLFSMCLSIAFIVVDTLSVLSVFQSVLPTGVEPFWKLSFIFKCLCDMVILDDFKTALDRMRTYWLRRMDSLSFPSMSSSNPRHDRNPSYSLPNPHARRPSDFVDLESAPGGGGGEGVGWFSQSTPRPQEDKRKNNDNPQSPPQSPLQVSDSHHIEDDRDHVDVSSSEYVSAQPGGHPFPKAMYLQEIRGVVSSPRR